MPQWWRTVGGTPGEPRRTQEFPGGTQGLPQGVPQEYPPWIPSRDPPPSLVHGLVSNPLFMMIVSGPGGLTPIQGPQISSGLADPPCLAGLESQLNLTKSVVP